MQHVSRPNDWYCGSGWHLSYQKQKKEQNTDAKIDLSEGDNGDKTTFKYLFS